MEGEQPMSLNNITNLLPNELWEVVLDKLEDTDEILGFLTLAPELIGLSYGKEFDWLMAKIIPLIMSRFLDHRDIFNCRLVSKRWRNAIDHSIEEHPERLPYNSNTFGKITKYSFCFNGFFTTNILPRLSTRANSHLLDAISGALGGKYGGTNPFFARSLKIVAKDPNGMGTKNAVSLGEIVPLLEHFGKHVWHLSVHLLWGSIIREEDFIRGTLGQLFNCFQFLPNLKSLNIVTVWPWDATLQGRVEPCSMARRAEILETINVHSPVHLDTLKMSWLVTRVGGIENLRYYLVHAVASKARIRKLEISIYEWEKGFSKLFPGLSELYITDFCLERGQTEAMDLKRIGEIIQDLPSQNVLRFGLRGRRLNVPGLLKIILPLEVESLQLNMCSSLEYRFESTIKEYILVSSIKEMYLHWPKTEQFKFVDLRRILRSAPLLKHLIVTCDISQEFHGCVHQGGEFERIFRNVFFDDDVKKESIEYIWEEFPSIQLLTVHRWERDMTRGIRFARECRYKLFKLYTHLYDP